MHNTERLERSFINIVHMLFIILTSLALVTALAAGIWGGLQLGKTPPDEIVTPSPTYQQMRARKAEQKPSGEKAEEQIRPAGQQGQARPPRDTIPAECRTILNAIEISLQNFGEITSTPVPDDIRKQIYDRAVRLREFTPVVKILNDLKVQSDALLADAERIAALPIDDPEYITWQEFLSFYFDSIAADIRQQKIRNAELLAQIQVKRETGRKALIAAGGAFGLFILLTLYLVLFMVEKHTRLMRDGMLRIRGMHEETGGAAPSAPANAA